MTTRFAQMERRVSAAIDKLHEETIRIIPRAAGEFVAGAVDATRPTRDVLGIYDPMPVIARLKDKSEYDGFKPEAEGDKHHVSIDEARLGARATWPRAKDHLQLMDRPGDPKLQIVTAEPDHLGRVLFRCVPVT